MDVSEEELTFVVQGPVLIKEGKNLASLCLESIRLNFPKSRIIFSTHKGMPTEGLQFDTLIVNETNDVQIIENDRVGNTMTMNLQASSTISGLAEVQTEYAVKIRSDMEVKNRNILRLLANRPRRDLIPNLTLTDELVIVLNWSTVNPTKYLKLPHHPSDHFFAGRTTDLKSIWNVPKYPLEFMRWFESQPYPTGAQHGDSLTRYRCETWIWMNFIKNSLAEPLDSSYTFSEKILDESIRFMFHNLEIVSARMAGVESLKNAEPRIGSRAKMVTHLDWVYLARKNGVETSLLRLDFDSIKVHFFRLFVDLFKRDDLIFPKPLS
jgi:hypothetical protein